MVPEDIHELILSSTHTGRFEVVDMTKEMFSVVQSAADSILNLKNANISKAVHIKLDKRYPGHFFSKENFSEVAPWKRTSI